MIESADFQMRCRKMSSGRNWRHYWSSFHRSNNVESNLSWWKCVWLRSFHSQFDPQSLSTNGNNTLICIKVESNWGFRWKLNDWETKSATNELNLINASITKMFRDLVKVGKKSNLSSFSIIMVLCIKIIFQLVNKEYYLSVMHRLQAILKKQPNLW